MPNPTKLIFVPPAGGTVDWSPYFINISPIQRRIESDKPGEAGVIMFDTVTIEMPLSKTGSYFDEDTLFGGSAKPKYHVQIKKHISGTDYQLFEGLIDVDSLKFTRHGTVQFDCYDKLSALKFFPTLPARDKKEYKSLLSGYGVNSFINRYKDEDAYLYLSALEEEWDDPVRTLVEIEPEDRLPTGVVLIHPHEWDWQGSGGYNSEILYFLKKNYYNDPEEAKLLFHKNNYADGPLYDSLMPDPKTYIRVGELYYYDMPFYGHDICGYDGGGVVTHFNALLMLTYIIKSVYPSITVVNRTGSSDYPISLGFFEQTVNMPFDRPILEAIKYLAASMRVYVYIDRSGQFIIDKWPGFGSEPSSKPDLSGFQTEDDYRFTWDKLIDQVTIETVAADGTKTEAVAGTEYKNPVNTLERTVFASDDSAQDIADDYFEFYGKRHRARSITRKLDATVAQLDLTSWVDVGDIDFRDDSDLYYFIEKMALDVMNDTVDLDLVSVKPFDL